MGNFAAAMTDKQFLFLDRDGVINAHRPDDYVKTVEEFIFLPGATEALAILAKHFRRIIIVTNQRGVAKGKMSETRLHEIHAYMLSEIAKKGGRIDAIYYSTALNDNHPDRKPNSGMAFRAKQDFPEILFEKSIMAGDGRNDMEFGNKLNMTTVLIENPNLLHSYPADLIFPSLLDFALNIENQ